MISGGGASGTRIMRAFSEVARSAAEHGASEAAQPPSELRYCASEVA